MKNVNVENNVETVCVECGNVVDMNQLKAAQRAEFKRNGLCPECVAKAKAARKAAAAEHKAAREAAKAAAAAKRAANPSAAAQVRTMLENASFNDEQLNKVIDFEFTKARTKISYQLLKTIDENADFEMEMYFAGGLRYQKKPLDINGRQFYMTNNIYKKNVELVRELLIEIGSLNDDTNGDTANG